MFCFPLEFISLQLWYLLFIIETRNRHVLYFYSVCGIERTIVFIIIFNIWNILYELTYYFQWKFPWRNQNHTFHRRLLIKMSFLLIHFFQFYEKIKRKEEQTLIHFFQWKSKEKNNKGRKYMKAWVCGVSLCKFAQWWKAEKKKK